MGVEFSVVSFKFSVFGEDEGQMPGEELHGEHREHRVHGEEKRGKKRRSKEEKRREEKKIRRKPKIQAQTPCLGQPTYRPKKRPQGSRTRPALHGGYLGAKASNRDITFSWVRRPSSLAGLVMVISTGWLGIRSK